MALFFLAIVAFALALNVAHACTCNSNGMCTNIPADNKYYLTSFCDSSVACGAFSGDCNEYYSADYSRFGCGSIISCCQGSDCLNLKVIDGGPGCSVENNAGGPVVDASDSTCKHFTGRTSCGWSDHVSVTCKKTSFSALDVEEPTVKATEERGARYESGLLHMKTADKIPLGPCSYNSTWAIESDVPLCGLEGVEF